MLPEHKSLHGFIRCLYVKYQKGSEQIKISFYFGFRYFSRFKLACYYKDGTVVCSNGNCLLKARTKFINMIFLRDDECACT